MSIVRKIDSHGRVVIPRDMRSILDLDDSDIEVILDAESKSIILRKYEDTTTRSLKELSANWQDDPEVMEQFDALISLIETKN